MTTSSCQWALQNKRLNRLLMLLGVLGVLMMVMPARGSAQAPFAASGVWQSNGGAGKTGTWKVTGTGGSTDLSGTFTATGPADVTQGSVYGSIGTDGGDIKLGILYNDVEEATFSGSVTNGAISGTYTTKGGDAGTWSGNVGAPQ